MKKITELYEEARDEIDKLNDYSNDLSEYIAKNIKLKGVMSQPDLEYGTGALSFNINDDIMIYATPFWEGYNGIMVDIDNLNTGDEEPIEIKMKPTYDMKKDAKTWQKHMDKLISKIKKYIDTEGDSTEMAAIR